MSEKGWIMLYRSIQDHWTWEDKPFSRGQAWLDLLLLANHKDQKFFHDGKVIEGKRGCVYRSYSFLADRWGWSRAKVMRFMKLLEADKMVATDATTHSTTITIVNYRVYQDYSATDRTTKGTTDEQPMYNRWTTDGQPTSNHRATTEQPTNTYNNDNNDNNNMMVGDVPQPTAVQYGDIVELWNSIPHTRHIQDIRPMTNRENEVRLVVGMYGYDGLKNAIEKVRTSPYLKRIGDVRFDSYITTDVVQKLLEGNYDKDYQAGGWKGDGLKWDL